MYGFVLVVSVFLRMWVALHTPDVIDDDAVVVDLSNLVEVPQVVEADFAVIGDEEPVGLARADAHVDVAQPPIHVHKHDVVVKQKQVHYQQTQVDYERQKETYETRIRVSLPVIHVKLEQITGPVLSREIYHGNQEKVKYRCETVPRDKLAKGHWETVDVLLR